MKMIPISERLPEDEDLHRGEVLALDKDGDYFICAFDSERKALTSDSRSFDHCTEIVSWCRLPSVEQEESQRQYFYSYNVIRGSAAVGFGCGGVLSIPSEVYRDVLAAFTKNEITVRADKMQLLSLNTLD